MAATGVRFRPRERAELWVYVPQGGWCPPCLGSAPLLCAAGPGGSCCQDTMQLRGWPPPCSTSTLQPPAWSPLPTNQGSRSASPRGLYCLVPGVGDEEGGDPAPGQLDEGSPRGGGVWDVSRGCSLAPGGLPGDIWLLSFSATAVLGGGLRPSRRVPGRGAPMSVGVRGPQLSSSGTGAAAGLLFFSSASAAAGRSRAGLGLECRCLRMKGKTLRAERG